MDSQILSFCMLGSGSRGNSLFIKSKEISILVDVGFSLPETKRRLAEINPTGEIDLKEIKAILLTHGHSDHIRGLSSICKIYKPAIYAHQDLLKEKPELFENLPSNIHKFDSGYSFNLEDLSILPFYLQHDYDPTVGFIISTESSEDNNSNPVKIAVATDFGVSSKLLEQRLKGSSTDGGCQVLILESNHDREMLWNGEYPWSLKQRVSGRSGHASNQMTMELVQKVTHEDLQYFMPAHISEQNNDPVLLEQQWLDFLRENSPQTKLIMSYQGKPSEYVTIKAVSERTTESAYKLF